MTDYRPPAYTVTQAQPGPQAVIVAEPPLSPRIRLLVIGLRRVCLLAADVLGEYAGLAKRTVQE